jgi:ABC-2 type transport system permease protein
MTATTAVRTPAPNQTGLLNDVVVLAERDLRRAFTPGALFATVLQPLMFFLIFYCTFGNMLDRQGIDYGRFVTPTLVVQAVMFVAIASAASLSADRNGGLFNRLRTMPLGSAAPGLARLVVVSVEAATTTVVIALVAHFVGFRFDRGLLAAVGFVLVAILFTAALTAATATVALSMRNQEAMGAVLHLPYLPLLILSTGFVPAALFPGWLQPIVSWSPVSAVVDALRSLSTGAPDAGAVLAAVGWCVALIVVFGYTSARAFRRATQ